MGSGMSVGPECWAIGRVCWSDGIDADPLATANLTLHKTGRIETALDFCRSTAYKNIRTRAISKLLVK